MAETPRNDTPRVALNNLKPAPGTTHTRKRVGRGQGSGNGKTAGRGHKGAQSRSGYKQKRGFEGGQMPLHRRVPKRGFHNPFRIEYAVVNLDTLGERFAAGTVVTPELLRERGIVRGPRERVKVLGRGEMAVALTVHAHKFSGQAAEKIRAAGGAAETIAMFAATETDAASDRPKRRNRRDVLSGRRAGRAGRTAGKPYGEQSQEHLRRARAAQACALHARAARRLSHRQSRADAGRQQRSAADHGRAGPQHDVRALRHVLGRQPRQGDDLRAGHHALHQRVDHPAAPDRRVAVPGAAVEGRRARAPQDHAVHALRHDRAGDRPGVRHRVLPGELHAAAGRPAARLHARAGPSAS